MKITENMIQQTLAKKFFNDFFMCNKFYSEFEADFLRITNSGFLYEYEIKMTVEDFRKDFSKESKHHIKPTTKHEMLKSGELNIKHFYFCAPSGIIPVEQVPEEFGLIEFRREGNYQQLFSTTVQKPRALSNHIADFKFKVKIMEKVFWSYKEQMCSKAKGEWTK